MDSLPGRFFYVEIQNGGKAHCAHDAQDIFGKSGHGITDTADPSVPQIFRAAVQMEPTNREYHRAAFQAAKNYQKHRKWPYRFADWANGLFHPRDREKM